MAGKDKTFVYEPDFAFFEGVKIDLQQVVRATSAAPTFFPGEDSAAAAMLRNFCNVKFSLWRPVAIHAKPAGQPDNTLLSVLSYQYVQLSST